MKIQWKQTIYSNNIVCVSMCQYAYAIKWKREKTYMWMSVWCKTRCEWVSMCACAYVYSFFKLLIIQCEIFLLEKMISDWIYSHNNMIENENRIKHQMLMGTVNCNQRHIAMNIRHMCEHIRWCEFRMRFFFSSIRIEFDKK